ncbi:MAG: hypothetical protein AAFN30_13080 [Actinomycetota bacterium]
MSDGAGSRSNSSGDRGRGPRRSGPSRPSGGRSGGSGRSSRDGGSGGRGGSGRDGGSGGSGGRGGPGRGGGPGGSGGKGGSGRSGPRRSGPSGDGGRDERRADRRTGPDRARSAGQGSGGGDQRRAGHKKTGPKRPGQKRIPPPPVLRDEVTIERIHDDPGPGKGKRAKNRPKPREVDVGDVVFADVAPVTAQKLQRRLAEAALAFEAERFTQADDLLASIERLAPGVPEVIEMRGLTFYRLGHWGKAVKQFEAFHDRTGSVEQHPVWADCCRALRRWSRAEELWRELGDASPSAELVEEGRIVQAGMLADRGRLPDAIRLLESAPRAPRKPGLHHLRRWYVLGDLYERTGDLAHARKVFGDIVGAEPGFGDTAERLAALG